MELIRLNYEEMQEIDLDTLDTPSYDTDAPYGRKRNGEPYKTSPAQRAALAKSQAKNKDKTQERNRDWYVKNKQRQAANAEKWRNNNRELYNLRAREFYYKKMSELEYYKELFEVGLQNSQL